MVKRQVLLSVAVVLGVSACRARSVGDVGDAAEIASVAGTYVAADSGSTLGKDWCYHGALVLDTTGHFGSVLTMCDEGGPVTEHLKGTYRVRAVRTRSRGAGEPKRIEVVLKQGGRSKTHTLRYVDGALRFDEPWILGAGLRALHIPDPVLTRVASAAIGDSLATSASSTPATAAAATMKPGARAKR